MRPLAALEPLPSKPTLLPAVTLTAEALMLAVGTTAVTFTVTVPLDCWPALSVTVSCTVKLPLPVPDVATVADVALVAEVNDASDPPLVIAQ